MKSRVTFSVLALLVSLPVLAQAETKGKPAGQPASKAGEVRRDPNGITGVSPFWEAVKKGDDLYLARDFDGAIAAYRDAITKAPQNPLGHYRIGEAHLAKNDTQEAEAAWVAGLRFVGADQVMKAKLSFVLADLRERQKSYDDAVERWTAYGQVADQPASKGFPKTAPERKQRIQTWVKLSADYAEVKKRIAARLKEADEKAKKDAQSDKNK